MSLRSASTSNMKIFDSNIRCVCHGRCDEHAMENLFFLQTINVALMNFETALCADMHKQD